MADVHKRMTVECPYDRAGSYVRAYLARHTAARERSATLTMRLPVSDLALERDVKVAVAQRLDNPRGNKLDVTWGPKGGGPYPTFSGVLAFDPKGEEACEMALDGAYEPPGGVLGKAFDATIGRRMALASVQSLLDLLKREIEGAFREDVARVAAGEEAPNYPPSWE